MLSIYRVLAMVYVDFVIMFYWVLKFFEYFESTFKTYRTKMRAPADSSLKFKKWDGRKLVPTHHGVHGPLPSRRCNKMEDMSMDKTLHEKIFFNDDKRHTGHEIGLELVVSRATVRMIVIVWCVDVDIHTSQAFFHHAQKTCGMGRLQRLTIDKFHGNDDKRLYNFFKDYNHLPFYHEKLREWQQSLICRISTAVGLGAKWPVGKTCSMGRYRRVMVLRFFSMDGSQSMDLSGSKQ
jgi:hypothetical protein